MKSGQAQEEDIEHRLLNQGVEEDRRCVEPEAQSGDEAHAPREQTLGGQAERRTGESTDDRLTNTHNEEIAPECRIDEAEEYGYSGA